MTPARLLAAAAFAALAALLAGCDHTQPFAVSSPGDSVPLAGGNPARLTYNPGNDLGPAWRPDGRSFYYTQARPDRADDDWCLAEMGDSGGTVLRQTCDDSYAEADTQNTFRWFAPDPLGRLAYEREATPIRIGWITPLYRDIMLGTVARPLTARRLLRLPVTSPSGQRLMAAAELQWLGPDTLVFLGQRVAYPQPCSTCAIDTVYTGAEVDLLDLSTATPTLTVVPGTDSASSVAVAGGDTLYFTRNGDTRIFRYALAAGTTDTVFDFDTLGVARDLATAGGALVAVAGGDVSLQTDPGFGTYQLDGGGTLYRVIVSAGAVIAMSDSTKLVRHPAVSPDGKTVVAEVLGADVDLWRWAVPAP